MSLGEGVHDIPSAEYHADPAPSPSLSRSIAKLLVERSPAHAYAAHPRLGGSTEPGDASDELDLGSAVHELFLRGSDAIAIIPFTTYQSIQAKGLRDEARKAGLIPLKTVKYQAAMRVIEALESFRARTGAFTVGKAEQTLIWREGAEWARCLVDWLPEDPGAPLWDLKTTSSAATERSWGRSAFDLGYDLQAAFYQRGAECVRGEPPDDMHFCVVETDPPYAIRVFRMSPAGLEIGQAKATHALNIWSSCRADDRWPGYPVETVHLEPPPWVLGQWQHLTPTGLGLMRAPAAYHATAEAGAWR